MRHLVSIMLLAVVSSGCLATWESGWVGAPQRGTAAGDAARLLEKAHRFERDAGDAAGLLAAIAAFERVLEVDPGHPEALARAAQYYLLYGTGYAQETDEKGRYFRAGIRLSERLMARNAAFKQLVDEGATVWDASHALTAKEADAMGWWTTGVFYYFKECVADSAKLFSHKWLVRNKQVMDQLDRVAPRWHSGANYFNYGIYYLALPEAVGGSMKRSAEYLEKAAALDRARLLVPWGRAKYFHRKRKDADAYRKDLEWVLAQDPRRPTVDGYAWNSYFQREARVLLPLADEL
jgi:tetratricopeptide (TPR) repeat protein